MKPHWCERQGGPRRWANDWRSHLKQWRGRLRTPAAVPRTPQLLQMPIEACVVRADVAVHGEVAAIQKKWERRYDEQSLHLLRPYKPRPRAHSLIRLA